MKWFDRDKLDIQKDRIAADCEFTSRMIHPGILPSFGLWWLSLFLLFFGVYEKHIHMRDVWLISSFPSYRFHASSHITYFKPQLIIVILVYMVMHPYLWAAPLSPKFYGLPCTSAVFHVCDSSWGNIKIEYIERLELDKLWKFVSTVDSKK